MPRPIKNRYVKFIPNITEFMPKGDISSEVIVLYIEELEAIRLVDLEKKEQTESADEMQISRGTLQRILTSARTKIADSLVYGKKLVISGGNFEIGDCINICKRCSSTYNKKILANCPKCHSLGYMYNKGGRRYQGGRK